MGVEIITERQKSKLREHKYRVQNNSLFEKICLNMFWDWLEQRTPKTWAPNVLSSVGLVINVITTLVLVYHSPNGTRHVPWWASVQSAVGLFIYQILDSLDGRQARRNNIECPLDEVYDHGCDAISQVFVVVGICVTLKTGYFPNLFLYQVCLTEICFYMAHWKTYVTDIVRFDMVDVTELQISVIITHLICALDGSIFDITIPIFKQQLRFLVISGSMVLTCIFTLKKFWDMLNHRKRNGLSVVAPAVPIGVVMLLQVFISTQSTIYLDHPCLYLLSFGFLTAKISTSLVVAHMTMSNAITVDTYLIGPILLLINQMFRIIIPERYLLWTICVYSIQDLLRYDARICQQICNALDMYCYSVQKKPIRSNGTNK